MDTTAPPTYPYAPLSTRDSIRLLNIHPSPSRSTPLHCTLEHTTLSLCTRDIITPFTALSYVWGLPFAPPDSPFTITLSPPSSSSPTPLTIPVTPNLHAALLSLRHPTLTHRIWADAICINQTDPLERSSQVSLMGEIYSTANHTVIHLALENETEDSSERILRALGSNTSGAVEGGARGELIRLAEGSILKAVWFTRVWVFQEVVLSKDPWVMVRGVRARWSDLCNLLLSSSLTQATPSLQILSTMNLARGPHQQALLSYLTTRRGLGATNPVDIIYSHLGLIADFSPLLQYMPISYTLPCTTIYESVAEYLLSTIGPAGPDEFFVHCNQNYIGEMGKRGDLASWAPDWSLRASGLAGMYRDNIISTLRLKCASYLYFTTTTPKILSWVGYEVAEIEHLSHTFPEARDVPDTPGIENYRSTADKLVALYQSAEKWWSGDEFGRYQHVSLRGKEEEHTRFSKAIAEEWMAIVHSLSPLPSSTGQEEIQTDIEESSQSLFATAFQKWLDGKIQSSAVIVGGHSEGLLNLLWLYLYTNAHPNTAPHPVLAGRRLAAVSGGGIAVVPEQAREGDKFVYLAGMENALVFRGEEGVLRDDSDVEEEVRTGLLKKMEGKGDDGLGMDVQEMRIVECKLVGEGYVDGEVGWRKKDKVDGVEREYVVFAMR